MKILSILIDENMLHILPFATFIKDLEQLQSRLQPS